MMFLKFAIIDAISEKIHKNEMKLFSYFLWMNFCVFNGKKAYHFVSMDNPFKKLTFLN